MGLFINHRETVASPKTVDGSFKRSLCSQLQDAVSVGLSYVSKFITRRKQLSRERVQRPRLRCPASGGCESKGSATQVLFVWKEDLWRVCSGGQVKLSCCLSFKSLPQVSNGFGADQWEDDVIVLLALEPVDCCHLQRNTNVHGNIKDMRTKLQQANAFFAK